MFHNPDDQGTRWLQVLCLLGVLKFDQSFVKIENVQ